MDDRKLSEIYSLYSKGIYWYIYRMVKSRETAEDILHDSFVKLINFSLRNDIDHDHIKGFLYTIAHNTALTALKRGSLIRFSPIDDNARDSGGDDFTKKIEMDELNARINELLDEVDAKGRSLFIMKKELNLTYDEISEISGMPERTVRRRIKNILTDLGKKLTDLGFIDKLMIILTFLLN